MHLSEQRRILVARVMFLLPHPRRTLPLPPQVHGQHRHPPLQRPRPLPQCAWQGWGTNRDRSRRPVFGALLASCVSPQREWRANLRRATRMEIVRRCDDHARQSERDWAASLARVSTQELVVIIDGLGSVWSHIFNGTGEFPRFSTIRSVQVLSNERTRKPPDARGRRTRQVVIKSLSRLRRSDRAASSATIIFSGHGDRSSII